MSTEPNQRLTLVTGAGGFIGGHLVRELVNRGATVRATDCKPLDEWFQVHQQADNRVLDLSLRESCEEATDAIVDVYNLAADMGGMGFIEGNKALCMLSVMINTHLLIAAHDASVERFFYASSACVYPAAKQSSPDVAPLREQDAYPADPEDGYGWEKLFSERMCRHYLEDFGLETRVARYHNVYGPNGSWTGGREKAPAAICRKVAEAVQTGSDEIEVWGDGKQTRSFMYVDDCVRGTIEVLEGPRIDPINLGSAELVTVDQLVDAVEGIAGAKLRSNYRTDAPQGVRGRNSDNTRFRETYGWEPSISLREGLAKTYEWVSAQVAAELSGSPASK
ncbi:MAG: NAD-dependent epimerase/dehydratase family protein [Actinomycetota bacterium]|nr:NAD-dependent epimerase/dehydratase family protein [Actinomycetota bacterium]